jgi:SAM-dependent methyltransferase
MSAAGSRPVYDRIGLGYRNTRQADPHIAARIAAALGDARTVVNVGAGTGNYEPGDRELVVGVDPARAMLGQRPPAAGPAVLGVAESLPFPDHAFDAALAVLTVHHWRDRERGLAELVRVAPRQVCFLFETAMTDRFWLVAEYFPEILDLGSERAAPSTAMLREHLDVERVEVVPVPADCVDGFAGCYWNRPEAYLRPEVRAGMSSFAQLDDAVVARGVQHLEADLANGVWDAHHGELRARADYDLGYRLVIAGNADSGREGPG